MAEERPSALFPELKEVENKLGRKTPESLLIWMRDAADCGDGRSSDMADRGDRGSAPGASLSDSISTLKQEMRWLRSADVRILRQLVAVHEGIEAMRWLMEERGALVSRGSSLTGSLSSLATVEEHGASVTPCRESPSPTCPQDVTGTTSEEAAGRQSTHIDDDDDDDVSPESTEARPPGPACSKFEVASSNPAGGLTGAGLRKSQPRDLDAGPLQDIEAGAGTITRALLRSRKARREVKEELGRKTPESLLIWMRDAADCEDGWSSDAVDRGDAGSAPGASLSDRISTQDVNGTTSEEAAGRQSSHTDDDDYDDDDDPEARPPAPHHCKFKVVSSNPAGGLTGAGLRKSQPRDLDAGPSQDIEAGAGTITRALLRSRKARREVKKDTSSLILTQASGETQAEPSRPQESLRASQSNVKDEEEEGALNKGTVLLGYDAQWCWVESEDDVTFL